jgi:protein TonB
MLPLSIAAHACAAVAVIVIPLAADDDAPPVTHMAARYVAAAVVVPADVPPPRGAPLLRAPSKAVSIAAPSGIGEEQPVAPPTSADGVDPAATIVGVNTGIDGGMFSRTADAAPPAPPAPTDVPARQRIVRPGGDITPPAKTLHVPPAYPAIARDNGVEGLVILEAVINERGVVERVKVLRSSPLLDQSAIDAVRAWRYTPTLLNGQPVQVLMTITVRFTLHD